MQNQTTEQVKNEEMNRNPTGKGGFGDNPENRNPGGRPKNQESITYWLNNFKGMTVKEFFNWPKENNAENRTVAADLAWQRILNAKESIQEFKVVADRTEGKASQKIAPPDGFFSRNKLEIITVYTEEEKRVIAEIEAMKNNASVSEDIKKEEADHQLS